MPPQKIPANLSIGDGFSFGCGFLVAGIITALLAGLGVFLLGLLLTTITLK